MITVSDAWKDIQQRFLLPESHIEIECGITDDEAPSVARVSGVSETAFSNAQSVVGEKTDVAKIATTELNLWALDGTHTILPDYAPYGNAGYVSNIESTGGVSFVFPSVRTIAISGITITWSETLGEYAKVFSVIGKNGADIVSEVTVTDNKERTSVVFVPLENYDSITITVHEWSLPYRRVRIENVVIGHILKFDKKDLFSYSHEQDGDLLSGKIPKYHIEFTLDNSDGRWDPNNPTGMAQYLSERQKLTVRYGLDVNGTVEWIDAGRFYLSEWYAPPNGIEARFVARDAFEFLLNQDTSNNPNISTTIYGNLAFIARWATSVNLPDGASVVVDDPALTGSAARQPNITGSMAEVVQRCANAACCIMRCSRDGVTHIESLNTAKTDYSIPLSLSYSYPEITLSKPLAEVSVSYGAETPYLLRVSENGEQQTLGNDYIYTAEAAEAVAAWVGNVLKNRKTIRGEFRADPRLDLYDIVEVEDRYGRKLTVAITNIKYTFNGSFRGSYAGRILEEG